MQKFRSKFDNDVYLSSGDALFTHDMMEDLDKLYEILQKDGAGICIIGGGNSDETIETYFDIATVSGLKESIELYRELCDVVYE